MTEGDSATARGAHRPSRRSDVVEAAIRVFAADGLRASAAAIAEASGMSPASIYYHFPTKEDLMTAALEAVSLRITETTTVDDSARDIPEAIEAVWAFHRTHAAETRLLYERAATGPKAARSVRDRFVARHVHLARGRMRPGEREPESRLELAVDEIAARAYVRLAMNLSLAWSSGVQIAGHRRSDLIIRALIAVGERLTTRGGAI